MKRWFALQTEDEMRFFDNQSKEHCHEGANLDLLCRSTRSCLQETLHDKCVIAVEKNQVCTWNTNEKPIETGNQKLVQQGEKNGALKMEA